MIYFWNQIFILIYHHLFKGYAAAEVLYNEDGSVKGFFLLQTWQFNFIIANIRNNPRIATSDVGIAKSGAPKVKGV